MNFWIYITLITLVIGVIAFYPLLKKSVSLKENKRDTLNKAFYFDRLQEVEREASEGVIDDAEQTKLELQQSLLDDIPAHSQEQTFSNFRFGKLWFVALLLLTGGISVGAYLSVGSWFSGTMMDMSHQKLDYFFERIKQEETDPLSEQEMNQFVMALRVELQNKPNDHALWFMLGQLGMATENGQLALDSFAKAVKLQPENLEYNQRYAQVLMFSADPKDKEQGIEVLRTILRKDHTNLDALSLLAFHYFEQEDYKMAVAMWGMMLKFIPDNDPRKQTIERSIQSALSMMKVPEDKKE